MVATKRNSPANPAGLAHRAAMLPALAAAAALWSVPSLAAEGSPGEAVRAFYIPEVHSAMDADWRDRFTDPAKAQLDGNDRIEQAGEGIGCIDWDLAGDGQDFDDAEIARTLEIEETVSGDEAEVTARFRQFPEPEGSRAEVVWSLRKVQGAWKVADIASVTTGWRLSALDCR